ncbi:prostate stem cell antigen-like [Branchiostoma floridae]|uniref:Prostate stem cell antigen-like n=1 Tax=Branchiostoma floridae TaxID=7739 RepID=A0A9J7KHC4_BRAFL|nr:prostate stem cell antigen-like [Branchiostoma floridae]
MARYLCILVFLLGCVTASVYCLNCNQCVAPIPDSLSECQAMNTSSTATNCSANLNNFCFTARVETAGILTGFSRGCMAVSAGNGCVSLAGVTTCRTFCATDGCNTDNAGHNIQASATLLLATVALAVLAAVRS